MDQPATTRRSGGLPAGVEVRERKTCSRIRVTFTWLGIRRRETLDIPVTPANIKFAGKTVAAVENAIERGTFDYAAFFPNSQYAKLHRPAIKSRPTVKELVDDYIGTARKSKSLSPSTLSSYDRWAKGRIIPKWGDRYVDEIQTRELRKWIAELTDELANKSVSNCIGLLSAVLSRALADSSIDRNPLAPIKLKSVLPREQKDPEDDVDPFNDEEIALILAAMPSPEERALWQFAFASGLRTGELIALKNEHVDLIGGEITVRDNIVSGDVGTVEKDTKTGKIRHVPLLPAAREAVILMRSLNRESTYLFVNPATGERWKDDQQMRKGSWIPALLRAKVRYRYPYQTRHTFASKLLEQGEQELVVSKLLGHATVEMVRRSYGRLIKRPGGIVLAGDYSSFGVDPSKVCMNRGADGGQNEVGKPVLIDVKQKTRIA